MRRQRMPGMLRILIAYDGSACADVALEDLRRAGLPAALEVECIREYVGGRPRG
jgi:hypothetical protein